MAKIYYKGRDYSRAIGGSGGGGGSVDSTDIPTAGKVSEFDDSAHMNSEDMSSQDVSDFVDGLDIKTGNFGIIPDYGNVINITSLPYTAPSFGIIMYVVGDGTGGGVRNLLINGTQIGAAYNVDGKTTTYCTISTITAFVAKGDVITGTYGVWGNMRFIPYTLGR